MLMSQESFPRHKGAPKISTIRDFLPPILVRGLLRLGLGGNRYRHGYSSWADAKSRCSGYDAQQILDTVVDSSRAVRDGKYPYERDGVLFNKIEYSWPLIAAILGTPREGNILRVLDWGGSLGSTYRQNRELLSAAGVAVEWTVIEQAHFVEIGLKEFQNSELKFVHDPSQLDGQQFDIVLFASSICYFDEPKVAIEQAVLMNPTRIIFDRTPETTKGSDLIGVQRVGKGIFQASFPVHSFARGSLGYMIGDKYSKICEWESDLQPDPQTVAKGYVFQRN